jgi:hypothetical protein
MISSDYGVPLTTNVGLTQMKSTTMASEMQATNRSMLAAVKDDVTWEYGGDGFLLNRRW